MPWLISHSRNQRLVELSTTSKVSNFGQVYPLQKPDYAKDVTEASNKAFVLVLLASSLGNNTESHLLAELWPEMAQRFGDIKFCEIRADMCIESYPERNTPTILVYRNGDIKKQIITLRELNGLKTSVEGNRQKSRWEYILLTLLDLQNLLVDVDAVTVNDYRIVKSRKSHESANQDALSDEGDDWD